MSAGRSNWPIVVGGCYRSGTSLVRRLLDAHPRIHCGPEVPFFRDFYGDYRDDRYAHLRYPAAARSILGEGELLEVLGGAFVRVHERAAAAVGKRRWADKAPENALHLAGWDALLGERWLYVHVARNPLDTLASMVAHPFPLTLPADLEGRIELYLRMTRAGLERCERSPERARPVVYEELVEAPERRLGELMAWLGEEAAPEQLDLGAGGHQPGLEDPKAAAADRVHGDGVGAWAEALAPADAERVRAATAELWGRLDPGLAYLGT